VRTEWLKGTATKEEFEKKAKFYDSFFNASVINDTNTLNSANKEALRLANVYRERANASVSYADLLIAAYLKSYSTNNFGRIDLLTSDHQAMPYSFLTGLQLSCSRQSEASYEQWPYTVFQLKNTLGLLKI
jgi:hypothetical protein